MAAGIVSWGSYLPHWRLSRQSIGTALGTSSGARGQRSVASHDEDTTSMAIEASRRALAMVELAPQFLAFATSTPAYLDKTNATAIHAALGLDGNRPAFDLGGAVRSGIGTLTVGQAWAELGRPGLVAIADMRNGLPGSADEVEGADGAVAFMMGSDRAVAEVVASAHMTEEFLDRWRSRTAATSSRWEERFGEHAYLPLGTAAVAEVLGRAQLALADIDYVVVAGSHPRAVGQLPKLLGCNPDAVCGRVTASIGAAGAAQFGLELCEVLDRAAAGQTILLVSLADGADAFVLRTTPELAVLQANRSELGLPTLLDELSGGNQLAYHTFLTWREMLLREPPRRPDPSAPAAPPTLRSNRWKFGFTASRCLDCGTRHLPPARKCVGCHAVDRMSPERLAEVSGTVATFTIDRLAYSLSPPVRTGPAAVAVPSAASPAK